MARCHGTRNRTDVPVAPYACAQVVEGHVPAAAVRRLAGMPTLTGVAVPGMPANSPGMGKMDGKLVTVDFSGKAFSKD